MFRKARAMVLNAFFTLLGMLYYVSILIGTAVIGFMVYEAVIRHLAGPSAAVAATPTVVNTSPSAEVESTTISLADCRLLKIKNEESTYHVLITREYGGEPRAVVLNGGAPTNEWRSSKRQLDTKLPDMD